MNVVKINYGLLLNQATKGRAKRKKNANQNNQV